MPSKIDYNSEPVFYCKHCLSLRIMRIEGFDDLCYCDKCNSTEIESADISVWEKLHQARYKAKQHN